MIDRSPLVTIATVVHDYGRFIGAALQSALDQPYRPIEVVVVDDGSTDDSAEEAAHFSDVVLIRQEHLGVADARNIAVEQARGAFVTFLDADDVMVPGFIEAAVTHLGHHDECAVVFPTQKVRLEPGIPMPAWMRPDPLRDRLGGVPLGAGLYRASTFASLGWFSAGLRTGEFFELLSRLPEPASSMAFLDVVGIERRIHGENLTYGVDALQQNLYSALQRRIREKRS